MEKLEAKKTGLDVDTGSDIVEQPIEEQKHPSRGLIGKGRFLDLNHLGVVSGPSTCQFPNGILFSNSGFH